MQLLWGLAAGYSVLYLLPPVLRMVTDFYIEIVKLFRL